MNPDQAFDQLLVFVRKTMTLEQLDAYNQLVVLVKQALASDAEAKKPKEEKVP